MQIDLLGPLSGAPILHSGRTVDSTSGDVSFPGLLQGVLGITGVETAPTATQVQIAAGTSLTKCSLQAIEPKKTSDSSPDRDDVVGLVVITSGDNSDRKIPQEARQTTDVTESKRNANVESGKVGRADFIGIQHVTLCRPVRVSTPEHAQIPLDYPVTRDTDLIPLDIAPDQLPPTTDDAAPSDGKFDVSLDTSPAPTATAIAAASSPQALAVSSRMAQPRSAPADVKHGDGRADDLNLKFIRTSDGIPPTGIRLAQTTGTCDFSATLTKTSHVAKRISERGAHQSLAEARVAPDLDYAHAEGESVADNLEQPAEQASETITDVEPQEVAEQVVMAERIVRSSGSMEFRLRLSPPELGDLFISLHESGDGIVAEAIVKRSETLQLIAADLATLQQDLENAGVELQRFDLTSQDSAWGRGRSPDEEPNLNGKEPDSMLPHGPPRLAKTNSQNVIDTHV